MITFMTGESRTTNSLTVRERAREALDGLRPSERRVARALLAAYPVAGLESITDLAARAGVSAPTVTRFVAKIGFDSYRDFQRALRDEVQAGISSPLGRYPGAVPAPDPSGAPKQTFHALANLLDETLRTIPAHDFEATVNLLADRRRNVWCIGGWWSQVLADYLFRRLHQLRPGVRYLGEWPTPRYHALLEVGRHDVVVVFDYRRYQWEVVDLAGRAAAQKASVVLVTDRWLSPIAGFAKHVLPTVIDTGAAFDSLVGGLAVVEALVEALVPRLGDLAHRRLAELDDLRASFSPEPSQG
ncbi:MAG TPA: MurR/RpiR family transcriptional regulator [Actinomycetes bacterium]|jgi:DNA-binding MurR/RpiR family transcriptional regulator|nr:MurR/RpiR family transcriptional regulator [Actinomycetes bacterium]